MSVNNGIQSTPIQEFYKNQIIFITGGTGFMGKVLLEKLLRCCPEILSIYLLVRPKKGKTPRERIESILADEIFDKVRASMPHFENKIIGLAGDISEVNIGLSDEDIGTLKRDVSIVFHCAASTRFDEHLTKAYATNIRSTTTITDMCKGMNNLKAFIYVSTLFAHIVNNEVIEEKFYDYPIDHNDVRVLTSTLSQRMIKEITPQLTKSWFNTYAATKAITENYLKTACADLPAGIFRPVIVTSSAAEPLPGWTDNFLAATGIIAGTHSGAMRVLRCDPKKLAHLAPVDFSINALIASAWDVANREGEKIYNYVSSKDAPCTWSMVRVLSFKYFKMFPLKMALWQPSLQMTRHNFLYELYRLFLQTIPAYLLDILASAMGKTPQIMKISDRVHKVSKASYRVTVNNWNIKDNNAENLWNRLDDNDKSVFRFTMRDFDWDKYFDDYIKGIRLYLFKEDNLSLKAARTKAKKLYLMNQLVKALFVASAYYSLRSILKRGAYKPPF